MNNFYRFLNESAPKYTPKDRHDLINYIKTRIKAQGNDVDLSNVDISKLKSLENVFSKKSLGTEYRGDLSSWDTSKIVNMANTFTSSGPITGIENWNTSSLEIIDGVFVNSKISADLRSWKTSGIKSAFSAFAGFLGNINASGWNLGSLKTLSNTFRYMKGTVLVSGWKIPNVEKLDSTFYGGSGMDLSSWDVSNVRNLTMTFSGSKGNFKIDKWNIKPGTIQYRVFEGSSTEKKLPDWAETPPESDHEKNDYIAKTYYTGRRHTGD